MDRRTVNEDPRMCVFVGPKIYLYHSVYQIKYADDFAQLAATKDLLVMMLCTPYVSNCGQA